MLSESLQKEIVSSCAVFTEMSLAALYALSRVATPGGLAAVDQRAQVMKNFLGPAADKLPVQELAFAAPLAAAALVVVGLNAGYHFLMDPQVVRQKF